MYYCEQYVQEDSVDHLGVCAEDVALPILTPNGEKSSVLGTEFSRVNAVTYEVSRGKTDFHRQRHVQLDLQETSRQYVQTSCGQQHSADRCVRRGASHR